MAEQVENINITVAEVIRMAQAYAKETVSFIQGVASQRYRIGFVY